MASTQEKKVAETRKAIEAKILKVMSLLDPAGDNTKRWQEFFGKMTDQGFSQFMRYLKEKKTALDIVMPNMKKTLVISDLLKAAKEVNLQLSHRLWLPDRTRPGKKYLTNEKYLVLTLPIRRAQQAIDKKMSVPSRDRHTDALTGQVVSDDKASAISAPEIQSLNVRGLHNTLSEIVRVRGGDVNAYGDFNRQLQENGEAKLADLDPRTRAKSAVISRILLQGMGIDSNF